MWAVSENTPQKLQVGFLIFPIQILFTNRIFSDLRRPPVLLPPLLAAGPLWVPYGKPHFGCPASKHFLQDKLNWRKDYCKKAIAHGRHIGAPYQIPRVGGGPDLVGGVRGGPFGGCWWLFTISLQFPYHFHTKAIPFPYHSIPFP